jgi:hypothetical protein
MRSRERKRPDRHWLPWSAAGAAARRLPQLEPQAHVEALEPRRLLANIHFVEGPTVDVDQAAGTVTVSGKIAGVGNQPVRITTTVEGTADISCQNPGGGGSPHFPPGQQTSFTISDTQTFRRDENGNVVFSITVPVDEEAILDAANACPNPKWVADVSNVVISSVTVTATQGKDVITFP